jgi:mannose-6-phosphate isomerase-like protein (cupin superfamily)
MTTTTLDTGHPFLVMQDLVRLHLTAEQTEGGFFVMEVDVAPGGGPPPLHTHDAAEFFWTLRGRLSYFRQEADGELTEITGGPGTWAFIPGGVPHTYRNFSDEPGAYLAVLSPPERMQAFLLAAGVEPGSPPRSPEEVLELGRRMGMQILDVVPGPQAALDE